MKFRQIIIVAIFLSKSLVLANDVEDTLASAQILFQEISYELKQNEKLRKSILGRSDRINDHIYWGTASHKLLLKVNTLDSISQNSLYLQLINSPTFKIHYDVEIHGDRFAPREIVVTEKFGEKREFHLKMNHSFALKVMTEDIGDNEDSARFFYNFEEGEFDGGIYRYDQLLEKIPNRSLIK